MMAIFLKLSRPALISLASALETHRLSPPYSLANVVSHVPGNIQQEMIAELNQLHSRGTTPVHIAYTLRLLAAEREVSQELRDRVELVWTAHNIGGMDSRDTSIVVRELFNSAKTSVLVSSFAIDKGKKAKALFQVLADRMDANPDLELKMFLNVHRPHYSEAPESVLLREFANTFRQEIWPGQRLPEVFHDPRVLSLDWNSKACLHAKCIVVDEEQVLITSANFTEAAHERNLEAGVLLNDPVAAKAMQAQFETLINQKILRRVPGIS